MELPSSASALGDNESQIEHNFGEYEGVDHSRAQR